MSNLRLLALQKALSWADQNPKVFSAAQGMLNNPLIENATKVFSAGQGMLNNPLIENASSPEAAMMMQMLRDNPGMLGVLKDNPQLGKIAMESAGEYLTGARQLDPGNTFDTPEPNIPSIDLPTPNKMTRAFNWMTGTPLGEEIVEGTLGGLMAGAGMLASDQSGERTALQTATAIAGGIGIGMLGRRAGEAIGSRLAPNPLSDQMGLIATIGRLGGSETTVKGLEDQAKISSMAIQNAMRKGANNEMAREATEALQGRNQGLRSRQFMRMEDDPSELIRRQEMFTKKYGVTPEEFIKYQEVDEIVGNKAASQLVDNIDNFGDMMQEGASLYARTEEEAELVRELAGTIKNIAAGENLQPVTGKQVGKTIGRLFGDEVGVIGGLMAGGVAANQLGFKTDKDKRIDKLQQLLAQHGIDY